MSALKNPALVVPHNTLTDQTAMDLFEAAISKAIAHKTNMVVQARCGYNFIIKIKRYSKTHREMLATMYDDCGNPVAQLLYTKE